MITMPATFTAKLVGSTFTERYPHNILELADKPDAPLALVHNPDNEYDSNAVEVRYLGELLGHLPRAAAARVAEQIDTGVWEAHIVEVLIHPEHPDNPGLTIRCERKNNG